MIRFVLAIIVTSCAASLSAEEWVHPFLADTESDSSPPPAVGKQLPQSPEAQPAVLTNCSTCSTGYTFEYSNGGVINETFVDYVARTGQQPPEARPTCATGHCGTFTTALTLPTGGCTCGCAASSCSCHHSPNAGKPLAQQAYNEPRVSAAVENQQHGYPSTATMQRGRLFPRLRIFRR